MQKFSLPHGTVLISIVREPQNCYCAIHPLKIGRVPKNFNMHNFGPKGIHMQDTNLLHQTGLIFLAGENIGEKKSRIRIIRIIRITRKVTARQ